MQASIWNVALHASQKCPVTFAILGRRADS